MARSPRLVVFGQPLHLIHRGHNRQVVFFGEDDYHRFLSDLTQAAGKYRGAVHAYVALFDHEVSGREITAIREGTEKGAAIGSEHFQEEMARRLQRRLTRWGYGGDRKSQAYRGVE